MVVPHCFFSGFVSVFFLQQNANTSLKVVKRLSLMLIGYLVFFILLEIIQIFIPGRTISGADVIFHVIGVTSGAITGVVFGRSIVFAQRKTQLKLKFFSMWLFLLIYLSIYPMTFNEGQDQPLTVMLIDSLRATPRKGDVIANLLLGWPPAWIVLDLLSERKAGSTGRGYGFLVNSFCVVIVVTATAICVEMLQFYFAERVPSLYDIIFQGAGASIAVVILTISRFVEMLPMVEIVSRLGKMEAKAVFMIAFLICFVCFEWTPWFPSIELSSIRDGLRELSLPFTNENYPWDLHWSANRLGVISIFLCSSFAGFACDLILRDQIPPGIFSLVIRLSFCFYGLAVELGKVVVSTKIATPILVLASICGGLLAVVIIILPKGDRPKQAFRNKMDRGVTAQ